MFIKNARQWSLLGNRGLHYRTWRLSRIFPELSVTIFYGVSSWFYTKTNNFDSEGDMIIYIIKSAFELDWSRLHCIAMKFIKINCRLVSWGWNKCIIMLLITMFSLQKDIIVSSKTIQHPVITFCAYYKNLCFKIFVFDFPRLIGTVIGNFFTLLILLFIITFFVVLYDGSEHSLNRCSYRCVGVFFVWRKNPAFSDPTGNILKDSYRVIAGSLW